MQLLMLKFWGCDMKLEQQAKEQQEAVDDFKVLKGE